MIVITIDVASRREGTKGRWVVWLCAVLLCNQLCNQHMLGHRFGVAQSARRGGISNDFAVATNFNCTVACNALSKTRLPCDCCKPMK